MKTYEDLDYEVKFAFPINKRPSTISNDGHYSAVSPFDHSDVGLRYPWEADIVTSNISHSRYTASKQRRINVDATS